MPKTNIRLLDTIPNDTIILEKNSRLILVGLIKKGWVGKRHLTINAKAKDAHCECIFFILGKDDSSFSATIEAVHSAPHTAVKARIRAVLTDKAACDIEGVWKVEPKATNADTYFSHHTLLLSNKASVKTSPFLEIRTDAVKAGHAASIGKVDEDALFYLLSRGLPEKEARTLMVEGFFEKELALVEDESVVNKIRTSIISFLANNQNEK